MSALLTNSRLRASRRCAREQHLYYELGYVPVETDEESTRRFGTVMHVGLEAWWCAVPLTAAPEPVLEAALAALAPLKMDPFVRVKAEVMMAAYHHRWIADAELYEVLAVEREFETALVNPLTNAESRTFRLGGKIDAIVRERATGRVLVVEHKTTSEDVAPGSAYWKRLRMDSQVSTYFDGAESLGYRVDACLYDVLSKPGQRPAKATPIELRKYTQKTGALYANQRAEDETPEEFKVRLLEKMLEDPASYFARGEVLRLEQELYDARLDSWEQARVIRENQLAKRAPRNPEACERYGRLCAFWEVCTGAASLDDTTKFTRTTQVHSELSEQTQEISP